MQKLIPFLFSIVMLSACSVDSPISVSQNFFKQIQDKNYQIACQSMVNSKAQILTETELKDCVSFYQTNFDQLNSFTIENALPLPAEKLQALGIEQGFEVYYTAKLNPEVKHEKASVVKVNGKHALVWER